MLQDLNQQILDAVTRLRRGHSRRGNRGRKRRRGRPTKAQQRRRSHQQRTQKAQAKFVFKRRHLIVKRRDRLTEQQRKDLATMLEYLPALRPLREFADALQRLFAEKQSEHQAWCRWHALQRNEQYLAIPELKAALAMLAQEQFRKVIAFLRSLAAQRVRANNHVERCNRKLRYWEKVCYKWRRRQTLVRFLVLALDHWWKKVLPQHMMAPAAETQQPSATAGSADTQTSRKPKQRNTAWNHEKRTGVGREVSKKGRTKRP